MDITRSNVNRGGPLRVRPCVRVEVLTFTGREISNRSDELATQAVYDDMNLKLFVLITCPTTTAQRETWNSTAK